MTTAHYQMEKEILSCWPENGELEGAPTNAEDLFEEYVTFDSNDLLKDAQSPSALLDSLEDTLPNSFNDQDIFTAAHLFSGDATTSIGAQGSQETEGRPVLDFLEPADQIMPGGSISDSESLRLEGITLQSSSGHVTAPSSPPLMAQSSPTKQNRLVDSVYATMRRARHRGKPQQTQPTVSAMEMFQRDNTGTEAPQLSDAFECVHDQFDLKPATGPIDNSGPPLSPPLTGKIPYSGAGGTNHTYDNNLPFVMETFDDPFYDDIFTQPRLNMGGNNPSTPLNTPALKGEEFFFPDDGVIQTIDPASTQIKRPTKQQRNTSSAEWPTEGILTDMSASQQEQWSSSDVAYIIDSDGGSLHSPKWWDEAATSFLDDDTPSGAPVRPSHSSGNGNLAASDLDLHLPPSDLSYEFTNELSGLMIHMPQPRQPHAAVLMTDIPEQQQLATPTHTRTRPPPQTYHHHPHHPTPSSSSSASAYHHPHSMHHYPRTPHHHRRPQPRAPSSDARHHHHHHHYDDLTSPRKRASSHGPPPPSSSSSSRRSASSSSGTAPPPPPPPRWDDVSASPSPSSRRQRPPGSGGYREGGGGGGGSLSVRKQRSWSSARRSSAEPRNYSGGSSSGGGAGSVRFGSGSVGPEDSPGGDGGENGGGGGGGAGGGFVNFTPSDKNILMTGVAPSGSSKTKARREKEAADRRRKLSEAAVKAVQAAGGDVEKLVREGFVV
jgi:hypothetical protein